MAAKWTTRQAAGLNQYDVDTIWDVEEALNTLEEARAERGVGNEGQELGLQLWALVQRIDSSSQLDRLVAGLPRSNEVLERVDEAFTRVCVLRTDEELREFASTQIQWMFEMAREQRSPASPTDVELLGRLVDLPVVVLGADAPTNEGVIVKGVWNWQQPTRSGPLANRELDRISALDSNWPTCSESIMQEWHVVVAALAETVESNRHVDRWILAPVTEGALVTEPIFRIWQAGAHLRIQVDRVEIIRSSNDYINSAYIPN